MRLEGEERFGYVPCPKGVERNSWGKSGRKVKTCEGKRCQWSIPLIQSGIDPPVRNPTQSFVNELQLKS